MKLNFDSLKFEGNLVMLSKPEVQLIFVLRDYIEYCHVNDIITRASYPILHHTKEDFNDFMRISSPSSSTISLEPNEDFNACNLKTAFNALTLKLDYKVHPTFNAPKMNVENNFSSSEVTSNLHNSSSPGIEDFI